MKSLSVCHLLLGYYPQIGGAEIQARRLAAYQRERGLQVCVVARRRLADPVERTWPAYEEIDGIPVYRVPAWGKGCLAALTYLLFGLGQLFRLRHRYQVIHAHMLSAPAMLGGLAGRLLGKKVVAKASSGGIGKHGIPDNLSGLRGSLGARIRQRWLKMSIDRYLAISHSIADTLHQIGFPHDRIIQIPNGIDVHKFTPPNEPKPVIRSRLGLPSGPLLVYVGSLRPRKNLSVLIKAIPLLVDEHPTLHLAFVGAGSRKYEQEEYRLRDISLKEKIDEHILFIEQTSNPLLYLQASDLFVIPSFKEGLSNAMLEAMAVGLPIIATPVSGVQDLIRSGDNGFLLPPDPTPEDIAQVLAPLLQDPDTLREMGRRARQTVVKCCSFEVVGERIISLYRELLEER